VQVPKVSKKTHPEFIQVGTDFRVISLSSDPHAHPHQLVEIFMRMTSSFDSFEDMDVIAVSAPSWSPFASWGALDGTA
jgi:hypothetical protein